LGLDRNEMGDAAVIIWDACRWWEQEQVYP
jgi:hypothetical protein